MANSRFLYSTQYLAEKACKHHDYKNTCDCRETKDTKPHLFGKYHTKRQEDQSQLFEC